DSQRRHERTSFRAAHGERNAKAFESTATMIKTRNILITCVALCCSSCGGIHNALNPTGPQAQNLSRLWWLFFIVSSVVFVIVMIAVLLSLGKRTAEPTPPVIEPPREQERKRRNVVISAVTITVIILFVFLIASYSAG